MEDGVSHDGEVAEQTVDTASHDDGGNGNSSSLCVHEFMTLMNCATLDGVSTLAFNLIQLLELGQWHLVQLQVRANICYTIKVGSGQRRGGIVVSRVWKEWKEMILLISWGTSL